MKRPRILLAAFTALVGALAASQGVSTPALAEGAAFNPTRPVALPSGDVDYQNVNEAIQMAVAWGDRAIGPHGSFGKFPPNFITPIHTHNFAYHGVVLDGTMANPFGENGETNPPEMGQGSYWYVPAGAPHATACISADPCQFYFQSVGAFDFTPLGSN